MKTLTRIVALALVTSFLVPVIAGCGKSQKAMQSPDGLSNRQRRDKAQGSTDQ